MRSRTWSVITERRILLLPALSLALLLGLGGWLLFRLGKFPDQASALTGNLQATFALNQRIHDGVQRANELVHRQFEEVDPGFSEAFRRLNYSIGEMETHYLTLRIDREERLAVERIREAYDELGVRAGQIYAHLRAGERERALEGRDELQAVVTRLDREFRGLGDLQVAKLDAVTSRLRSAVVEGQRTLLLLGVGVVALLIFSQAELERRVEERSRQIQELQESLIQTAKLSALGQLVGGVAHELNNPLTAILGYAQLTRTKLERRGADSGLIEGQRVIEEQVERCKRIVGGLSQFARPQKPRLEPVRLNCVVERVLSLREYGLGVRNVSVVRDLDPSDPELAADPYKLEQVVLNLLNNAHDAILEAGHGHGSIRVSTSREGSHVTLAVEDDGAGIREPERIFEPFYTTKEVGQGTGLGLSVCYGIVEEHRGEIRAENRNPGARLTVTLPLRPPRAAAAGRRSEPAVGLEVPA